MALIEYEYALESHLKFKKSMDRQANHYLFLWLQCYVNMKRMFVSIILISTCLIMLVIMLMIHTDQQFKLLTINRSIKLSTNGQQNKRSPNDQQFKRSTNDQQFKRSMIN